VGGAVYQMLNHGLSTGALFLLVGMIYERRHTRLIAEFGGLWKPLPVFAAIFLVVMLSSVGLPGLNGFVGEFLILLGAFGPIRGRRRLHRRRAASCSGRSTCSGCSSA
jgi:NADH-quinone oxidoreductase subunit M